MEKVPQSVFLDITPTCSWGSNVVLVGWGSARDFSAVTAVDCSPSVAIVERREPDVVAVENISPSLILSFCYFLVVKVVAFVIKVAAAAVAVAAAAEHLSP